MTQDETQSTITDQTGKAEVAVDGCVEIMTFEVNPQSSNSLGGHQCFAGGAASLRSARRSNWNVRKDQKFKINLQESKDLDFKKVNFYVVEKLDIKSSSNKILIKQKWLIDSCFKIFYKSS